MSNIIEVYPEEGKICKTKPVWQWDSGDKIHLNDIDLPPSYKAEFSNVAVRGTAKPRIQTTDTIEIPPEYQESGEPVYTWIVFVDESGRQTVLMIHTPVSPRAMPTCQPIAPSKQNEVDQCLAALNAGVAEVRDAARELETLSRVTSLDNTALAPGNAIEAVGIPVYVQDVTPYAAYGITATGWYVFARIAAPAGEAVTAGTTITGAAGYIATVGGDHVDLAVRFDTTAQSVPVTIAWGNVTDRFVFKASDLAARNLDYRVTFYIYNITPYATWSYALTTDTAFAENKAYYTKDENDVYTLAQVQTKAYALTADTAFQAEKTYYTKDCDTYTAATVTVGDPVTADTYYEQSTVPVPENTYYNHSKLHFEGMVANVTYMLPDVVDCPIEIALPEIADDGHGAWFEIQMRYDASRSCTLLPPEGVKVGTAQTQAQTAGINTIDLQYTVAGDVKMWTLLNTHSNIPTT